MRRRSLSVNVLLELDVVCGGLLGAGAEASVGTGAVFRSGSIGLCNGIGAGGLLFSKEGWIGRLSIGPISTCVAAEKPKSP